MEISESSWCDVETVDEFSFISFQQNDNSFVEVKKETFHDSVSTKKEDKVSEKSVVDNFSHIFHSHFLKSIHSIASQHTTEFEGVSRANDNHSVDTIQDEFSFTDAKFKSRQQIKKEQANNKNNDVWIPIMPKKRKSRMKTKFKKISKLTQISEEEKSEEESINKKIFDIKDLNNIVRSLTTFESEFNETDSLVNLCNDMGSKGVVKCQNTGTIILSESPLIGEKLRSLLFKKLILKQDDCSKRREIWIRLNFDAKLLLTPLGTVERFRDLFNVHRTVKVGELLSVKDLEYFSVLEKSEWVRVVIFGEYIRSKKYEKQLQSQIANKAKSMSLKLPTLICLKNEFVMKHDEKENDLNMFDKRDTLYGSEFEKSISVLQTRFNENSCSSEASKSDTFILNENMFIF